MIYLDNAATTYPKPPEVLQEMVAFYSTLGVSPGRGSYDLSTEAEEQIACIRRQICQFFGASDPDRVIFSYNATDALNTLIQGLVVPGSHVISSRLEHNSVLRPLFHFREKGLIRLDLVPFDQYGFIDPGAIASLITPQTRFVILTHASNVLGTIQPVERIGRICLEQNVPLVLDVTQTAGIIPISVNRWNVGAIAFTGHKALLGPTGIGGLVLRPTLDPATTRFGGTGRDSGSLIHTQTYPERLEAGTINTLGIFGLSAGLSYLAEQGIDPIHNREMELSKRLYDGLRSIRGVVTYPQEWSDQRVPLWLCNVKDMEPEDVSAILDADFGIATRAGLHCAPLVHQDLGTGHKGGVRFSLGPFNTETDIDAALEAMTEISGAGRQARSAER